MIVESDLNEENCAIYADEVALVNVFRRTKRGLRTGYWRHISRSGVLPYGPGKTSPAPTPSR